MARGAAAGDPCGPGRSSLVVGVFRGPWDTGWTARDGAVLGFEDIHNAFAAAEEAGACRLLTAEISLFRNQRRIREFLTACDTVYANCGPWAALLYLVRERENLDVRIIREVRTVGWVGYIWQEEVALQLERRGDQRVFPSRYARDVWDRAAPSISESRIYYPMTRKPAMHVADEREASGVVGFFSALARDKGFDCLPGALARVLAGGHKVERVILAGQQVDPALYDRVVKALSDMGVAVDFRGGLPNHEVRTLMADCDVVLFLSVSSIESLGRVIIEACEQGVPVMTSDFGAARDLVHEDYRIPVEFAAETSGHCNTPFPVAQLDLERWLPPNSLSPGNCFLEQVERYTIDAQAATNLLQPPANEPPASPWPAAFSFQCEIDGLQLAEDLLEGHEDLAATPVHELLDLGGALKQFLLSRGYNPRVRFQPAGEAQARPRDTPAPAIAMR